MGFWTDWLAPDPRKAQSGKQVYDPMWGEHICTSCWKLAKRCKCDPDLGRERRWWE